MSEAASGERGLVERLEREAAIARARDYPGWAQLMDEAAAALRAASAEPAGGLRAAFLDGLAYARSHDSHAGLLDAHPNVARVHEQIADERFRVAAPAGEPQPDSSAAPAWMVERWRKGNSATETGSIPTPLTSVDVREDAVGEPQRDEPALWAEYSRLRFGLPDTSAELDTFVRSLMEGR